MKHLLVAFTLVLGTVSFGQEKAVQPAPTFSLEAAAINGAPIEDGPTTSLTAKPGDRISAEFLLRDWSPEGEGLRGFQIQIDEMSYRTGEAGWVEPVGLQAKRTISAANTEHAYVDLTRPDYVFSGRQTVPVVDTVKSGGYRWISVLLDAAQAPIAPQDGTKFYCGTIELEVSEDAAGTFYVGAIPEDIVTMGINANGRPIAGIQYEPLAIRIDEGSGCRILSSTPRSGEIDARVPNQTEYGRTVDLQLSCDPSSLSPNDFRLSDGTSSPPRVRNIRADGTRATLELTAPLAVGRWTTISLDSGDSKVKIGRLPGDVNNDGTTTPADAIAMINAISNRTPTPDYRIDLNGDGVVSLDDLTLVIELLSPNERRAGLPNRLRD